jgi:hypothetical protein
MFLPALWEREEGKTNRRRGRMEERTSGRAWLFAGRVEVVVDVLLYRLDAQAGGEG